MSRPFSREMITFSKNGAGTTGYPSANNEVGPLII
jgi:hypothetical protein